MEQNQISIIPDTAAFSAPAQFEHSQRVAKMLASSSLIPKEFQGNIQNTMIALEIANRIGASPLMVMQNLYIVHGKPSWSSTFIIAAINSCNKFSPLRFEVTGEGDNKGCVAWCLEKGTNERLESPRVNIEMAKKEGWFSKAGSKWQTMPELMMRYRSAAFFGRLYAPEIMMGMQTFEEIQDVKAEPVKVDKEAERAVLMIADCKTVKELMNLKESLPEAAMGSYEVKLNHLMENEMEVVHDIH